MKNLNRNRNKYNKKVDVYYNKDNKIIEKITQMINKIINNNN